MHKKLSIITVCKNEIDTIKDTCNSILNQSYKNFEWIIIDGGSRDGTIEYLSQFKDHISHFVSEKDNGIYNAINKGIKLSSGNYLIFLNGGDYFYSNESLNIFKAKRDEDILYGNLELKDEKKIKDYPSLININYFKHNMLPHQATFYKKDLFDRFGLYDESYQIAGDYEFNLRIFQNPSLTYRYIPKTISTFLGNGISNDMNARFLRKKENHRIRKKYFLSYRISFKCIKQTIRNYFKK